MYDLLTIIGAAITFAVSAIALEVLLRSVTNYLHGANSNHAHGDHHANVVENDA